MIELVIKVAVTIFKCLLILCFILLYQVPNNKYEYRNDSPEDHPGRESTLEAGVERFLDVLLDRPFEAFDSWTLCHVNLSGAHWFHNFLFSHL